MKKMNIRITGLICVSSVLLCGGCKSSKNAEEAKGLQFEAQTAAVTIEGVPGGIIANTLAVQAKVMAIDYTKREAKLLLPGGETVKTKVGPEAVNFDQVKVGDIVNAVVTEEMIYQLAPADAEIEDGAAVAAALAEKGQLPAGVAATAVRLTATIEKIDLKARKVKLLFEDGSKKTVKVRADVDMNLAKIGDKVVIDIFQAVALSVEKNPSAETVTEEM